MDKMGWLMTRGGEEVVFRWRKLSVGAGIMMSQLIKPAAQRANPQRSGTILVNRHDVIMAQTFDVVRLVLITSECLRGWIIAIDAAAEGANP